MAIEISNARSAVEKALDFLAKKQTETADGSYPQSDAMLYAPIGVSSLATLAFLGAGELGHSPRAKVTERGLEYLLAHSSHQEGEMFGYISAQSDAHSRMHGHGYATLALAEALGMQKKLSATSKIESLQKALESAVHLIEKTQGDSGGWYYPPKRDLQHEGSITIVLIQALRAARNAGITVDKGVIDKAIAYVKELQKEDGSFRYQLGSAQSSAALTAAGVATLNFAGVYEGNAVEQGIDFLLRREASLEFPSSSNNIPQETFPEYGRFYTAQAFYQHRDPRIWRDWYRKTVKELVASQRTDGSWSSKSSDFGSIYVTAMNCLSLEVSFGYLPIFQR